MLKDDLDDRAILLVEDDTVISVDVTSIIELAGGKVIGPANSLGHGFHLLESERIDCALLDINLNSLLVFGLADALAERNVPIVFLSAESPADVPMQHRQRPFVRKPFSHQDVLAAIHAVMGEKPTLALKRSRGLQPEQFGDSSTMAAG